MEPRCPNVPQPVSLRLALNVSGQHGVRPRAPLVHRSRPNVSVPNTPFDELLHSFEGESRILKSHLFGEPLNINSFLDVLSDEQVAVLRVE